ncbi:MAG: hypothetical protein U0X20_03615 [Caldilineaceae bacterium]
MAVQHSTKRTRRLPVVRGTALAVLVFVGLGILFYAPVLSGLRTFPDGDFTHHFLPFSLFQQQEMLAWRLPVWNPYAYSGHPFLADVQAAVFYPVSTLLLAATLPWQDAGVRLYFLQLEAVLQVVLASIFTFVLVRQLTSSFWAGLLAGISFAFSGYLTGYPPVQLAVLRTAIWLPLLLWLLLRMAAEPRRWRWWMATGVAVAVAFLAGHSQTFLYVMYAAAAWAMVLFVLRWRSLAARERGLLAAAFLASGLLALGLSAAQLLPSAEFAGLSVRANVDYAFVAGGFPLQDTWQLLLPAVLTQYSPLYIGAIGLGFAWLGVWFVISRQSQSVRGTVWTLSPRTGAAFFLAATVLALLLSYGGNGFLYPIFYRFAPGWNLFRGQERAAYLVALGLSALAGYGALASQVMPQRSRSWWATAYTAIIIGAVYLFGLLWQLPGRTAITQNQFLVVAALTVTLVSVYAVLLRTPGWSRRRWLWLIGLTAANLFVVNMGTNVADFDPARKTILAPEVQAVQAAMAATAADANGLPGRVYNEFRSYEDYGMRAGVEDVWGSSPLRLGRYAALFEEFPLDRMWRLLGVEHVLTWRKELFGPTELLGEFPQATDTTYLHRLPAPHPRAWLVSSVQPADDKEALALLADHQFDLDTTAVLAPSVAAGDLQGTAVTAGAAGSSESAKAKVHLQQRGPANLHVEVQDSPGGLLVIAENWMPGWRVQNVECASGCQGEAPLGLPAFEPQRANLTLVGVPVPAGSFTFDLVYHPDSVRWGLWISGVTLLVLAVLAAWRSLAHRKPGKTPA